MPRREPPDRRSMALWASTASTAAAGLVLVALEWRDLVPGDLLADIASAIGAVLYASLGALIVRRARNPIGWLLQGVGLGLALGLATGAYAVFGIATSPASVPAAGAVGAIGQSAFVLTASLMAFVLFFFPTGSLPSSRWRPVVVIGTVAVGLTAIGFLLQPSVLNLPEPGGALRAPNPLGVHSLADRISTGLVLTTWVIILSIGAAFVAVVLRYRAGDPEQRHQIKWVAFVAALAGLANMIAVGALLSCRCDSHPVATAMYGATVALVFFGMPAAFAVSILRYRLYDIDVIINRAVVYGLLAAAITVTYVGIAVGIGTLVGRQGSSLLTIAVAVVIALLFQPVRQRAQWLANRLVYGERATPYQVLSDLAERMGRTEAIEEVMQRTAAVLAQGTGATRVEVWLRVGSELRSAAIWPPGSNAPGPVRLADDDGLPASFDRLTRAVPVRHDDELLGALAVEKPRNEPLTSTEDELLRDLAAQAGLVLRNVRLTTELQATIDELRASRSRLVEAQDDERRRIERNLHDGAQQQLVALAVQLGLLERSADDPTRVRDAATRLREAVQEAVDNLRDLARGIYPPLLADKGLGAAVEAQARRASVPTTVETDGIGRYPREIEAAVYFCILEAMQNAAKHADAASMLVRLREGGGTLEFAVVDDGRGFDPDATTHGTGTQGMIDRLDAVGGRIEIASGPGAGTTVRGTVPHTGT